MKKIIGIFLLSSIMLFATAIEGGFGYKLGEVFDVSKATAKSTTTSGEILYAVKAKTPIKYFKKYYLLITPTTHKIREIWAIASYKEKGECTKDMDVIGILLEKKYGKLTEPSFSTDVSKYLNIGERGISIRCSGFMDFQLYLQYTDNNLNNLSKRETAEAVAESMDSSAL